MPISSPDYSRSNSVFDFIRIFLENRTVWQLEKKRIWLASALLAGGLLLTLTASLLLKTDVETKAKTEFDLTCTDLNNKISARLYTHAQLLRSGAAFIENSEEVTINKWLNFYANQRVEKKSPGIQGIGYSVIIHPDQLALHEKQIQSEGFPQYSVRPKGKREIYTSMIYLYPFSGRNLRAFGYDMFSEPTRRKAMETARDYNIAVLTEKITLVQETNKDIQAGILMYVPVYKREMPVGTIEERRRAINGWVYIPHRMNDLMKGILGSSQALIIGKNIRLEIFDNFSFNRNALLYDNKQDIDRKAIPSPLFSLKYSIPFNNDLWYLRFTKYDPAKSGLDYSKVWYVATGGISFSILLFVIYLLLINTNIRAYELAEELTRDLSENETKHSSMIFNISDVVGIVDADGIFKYNSPNIEKWFGWQPQDLIGTDGWLTVHPDDLERIQKEFFTLLENDKSVKVVEYRYKCKDGSYKPVYLTAANFINDPIINGVLLNYHDITERRQAEDATKALALRNQILLQTASDGIHILDDQGNVVEVNTAFCKMLGYTREELLQLNVTDWDAQFPAEELLLKIKEVINSNSAYMFTTHHRRKDGTFIDVEISSITVTLEEMHYFYASTRDITERKQSAEALRLRESYLSAIVENQSGLFWLKDLNGRVLMVNRKFSDLLGFDNLEELVGKTDMDLWPRELADKYIADDLRVIQTKKLVIVEESILDKDNVKWFETFKAPIINSQGNVIGTTGYSIDITERKIAELELLKLNEDLQISKMVIEENLIQEHSLVSELTETKETLEVINSEKDKLFSIIAHDLKGPFQGFMGLTELMAEDINNFSQDELSEVAREMHMNAQNIFTLLNNLLEWARMQQGAINFEPVEIDLSEIVSQNLDLSIKRGEQKGIEIINQIDKNQIVKADEAMLNSILRNLLSNAVKFTKHGGKVKVSSKETENNMVKISVTDSGIGMPEDISEKLFKIAEKVGRRGTDNEPSTGLGLLLCKEFVEKHGGRIWVESVDGTGTTFHFTLPAT
ncbi:MAG: PAS domain S-box protein [Ignavibacteria bacterium]